MKKLNKKPFNAGVVAKKINVESIYNQMRQLIARRNSLQEKQQNLWKVIGRNHCDRREEMAKITNEIGQCTHKLNGLINKLCQYRKTHKAMKLACQYLNGEITRINKIINHQANTVNQVERGRWGLIDSSGRSHTDTTSLRNYIKIKKEQVAKLQQWKQVVQKYAA